MVIKIKVFEKTSLYLFKSYNIYKGISVKLCQMFLGGFFSIESKYFASCRFIRKVLFTP